MSKRGPKRVVTNAVKVGDYGKTVWHVELECSHTLETKRKPKINEDKLCCKVCLAPPLPAVGNMFVDPDPWVDYDPMDELKIRATLASKVGVPIDQVEIVNGTATVFVDAQQLKRLT
jgi:hypothetical protein